MRGLALEGGGAKGAYHIGVVKALYEKGYEFDGFVGTSIGAVNAAFLAMGCFERAYELWSSVTIESMFDEDEKPLLQLADARDIKTGISLLNAVADRRAFRKIISNKGVSTDKMKALLEQYVDEDRIRESGKDFGLVTISLSERKPYELMLEDIPKGQLLSYIMASATLPGLRASSIEENLFIDGALYNNCPYQLLLDKGYDEVIVVRTMARGVFHKTNDPRVKLIIPSDKLGSFALFTPESDAIKLKLGYYDGLRFIEHLRGKYYYIRDVDDSELFALLVSLDEEAILKACGLLGYPTGQAKRALFERLVPFLGDYLKLDSGFSYSDLVIALLERFARSKSVDRFAVYDFARLRDLAIEAPDSPAAVSASATLSSTNLLARRRAAARLLTRSLFSR